MALFEQFPYTNFHEANLDWVVRTVNENKETVDRVEDEWKSVESGVTASAEKGDDAEASVSGNLLDGLNFHFVLPQGERGPQGATGARGPVGPVGPQGEPGVDGTSFVIKAMYPTYAALVAAHPTGEAGDAYLVGDDSDSTCFLWDAEREAWTNIGPIRGPRGIDGPRGPVGDAAGFGTPTAQILDPEPGNPEVTVTASGEDTEKVFAFTFYHLTGEKGDTGERGPAGPRGSDGERGPRGYGMQVKGIVETAADLANIADPADGDCYAVGTTGNVDIYIYNGSNWVDLGPYYEAGPEVQHDTVEAINGSQIRTSMLCKSGHVVHLMTEVGLNNNAQARLYGGAIARIPVGFRPVLNDQAAYYTDDGIVTLSCTAIEVYNPNDPINRYFARKGVTVFATIDTDGYIRIAPDDQISDPIFIDVTYITD